MKNIKKCQLKNLQKQQEDMKVTMLAFTKCARKISIAKSLYVFAR